MCSRTCCCSVTDIEAGDKRCEMTFKSGARLRNTGGGDREKLSRQSG